MIDLVMTEEEYDRLAMGLQPDDSIIVTKHPMRCACGNMLTCGYYCTTHNKYICNSHFKDHHSKCRITPNYRDRDGSKDVLHSFQHNEPYGVRKNETVA